MVYEKNGLEKSPTLKTNWASVPLYFVLFHLPPPQIHTMAYEKWRARKKQRGKGGWSTLAHNDKLSLSKTQPFPPMLP